MSEVDSSAAPAEPPVWLWQRQPNSVELEKLLVPASIVPDGWLPLLQHRYLPGDRVCFTYDEHHFDHHGVIVQDQGLYVAIDGDIRDTGYTIHKTDVRPEVGEPTTPDPPAAATVVSPHRDPVLRIEDYTITACWNLGTPRDTGWQPQARLRIAFQSESGFTATLYSVDELDHCGLRRERHRPVDSVVVHHHPAARRSKKAVRDCLRAALDIVRDAVDRGEPVVRAHFVPDATSSAQSES
ncbi:hypothetical protein [Amycolatopsis anabasis]|uniref:hypothetical protein n=1 Tax=Amycolatopsis anabasis TaxID=1840409 RepID=UPI00131A6EFC|nr:hypothetical protein [Amycolatopsis anabasis]